jgi:single stranded DNA-binding protein
LVVSQANTAPAGTEKEIQMNKVSLEGRLTKDPELAERNSKQVCDMRIAVNGQGNSPTLFIDVVAFGGLASETAEGLHKGSGVKIDGSLRYSEWETKTDPPQKRSRHSIIAREVAVTA